MSTIHDLKIKSKYFEDIDKGKKRFELRKNDRNYKVGDTIRFCLLFEEIPKYVSFKTLEFKIIYVQGLDPDIGGLKKGWVILGIKPIIVRARGIITKSFSYAWNI